MIIKITKIININQMKINLMIIKQMTTFTIKLVY